MSSFASLGIAAKGLVAAQRAMEITGQNISNINTEGYSRQRVEQTEAVVSPNGRFGVKNASGQGVEITGITRITDTFVNATARQDQATAAQLTQSDQVWNQVETNLGEPGTQSLSARMTANWNAWSALGSATGATAVASAKASVVATSGAVAEKLKSLDSAVAQQWGGLTDQAGAVTKQANELVGQIGELNLAILQVKNSGASPNEIMDQRDLKVAQLTKLTGARVTDRPDGMVDLYVGNASVLSGTNAKAMSVTTSDTSPAAAAAMSGFDKAKAGYTTWAVKVDGMTVQPDSGQLRGVLDGINVTLPGVGNQYDQAAVTLKNQVNAVYGTANGGAAGDFYSFTQTAGAPATAQGAAQGAAASLKVVPTSATLADSSDAGSVSRDVAAKVGVLGEATDGPSVAWRGTVVSIASAAQSADLRSTLADDVASRSAARRESVSGVNLDEEMTNLVSYQHAYAGAARVLTAMDQALETLIRGTGRVGL
ncbi:flagellar hook-associated protein FlgK [Kineococcus gynurae]|uniref:Flagellar hook-associated protein 1 n=1 Tax=Kineococcus gynurae TaxID=452979 RepID=A0ABV5LXG4_9ACTN